MNLLQRIFGTGTKVDFKQLVLNKAIILDVRTPEEFKSGHIKGAINVPLQKLAGKTAEIKKMNKPVITCCLSGGRSSVAKGQLAKAGIEVYNGGGWTSLQARIS